MEAKPPCAITNLTENESAVRFTRFRPAERKKEGIQRFTRESRMNPASRAINEPSQRWIPHNESQKSKMNHRTRRRTDADVRPPITDKWVRPEPNLHQKRAKHIGGILDLEICIGSPAHKLSFKNFLSGEKNLPPVRD